MPYPNSAICGRLLTLLSLLFLAIASNGCASAMAWTAPPQRDLSVLQPGISRSRVVAELGAPVDSTPTRFGSTDVYSFKQGYSTPTRATRATMHAAGDILTAFLWELAGMPIEAAFRGEDVRAEVYYDSAQVVQRVEYFQGAHLAQGGPVYANWMRDSETQQTAVYESPNFARPTPEVQTASEFIPPLPAAN